MKIYKKSINPSTGKSLIEEEVILNNIKSILEGLLTKVGA
jgi:hypothetical protein